MRLWIGSALVLLLSGCGIFVDGYGNGNGCFIAGTPISTPLGDTPIESLHPGDKVYAWDEVADAIVESVVEELIVHKDLAPWTLTLENGQVLHVTSEHPLYVSSKRQWIAVSDLNVGDSLKFIEKDRTLTTPKLSTIAQESTLQDTYNLKVRRYNNSFAQGILAHFY